MSSKLLKFVFVVFFIFAASILTAEDKEIITLTIEDAVDYALKNSKSLKSAAIDLEIKKRASDNAWNTLLPSLSASTTAARQNSIESTLQSANSSIGMMQLISAIPGAPTITVPEKFEDTEENHWAVVGSLSFQWNFNLAMLDAIKVSKKQYEAGLISWEQTSRDTEVNIRKLFYGILLQQENLKIQKESLENAKSRWEQAEINYRNGIVPRISMLNAKVTYENKKPGVLSAEQGVKQNKELFGFLLGLPYGNPIELVGAIEFSYVDVNANELFEKYISQNKDILALKKNKEMLELGIRAKQLSTFTPSFSLNWGYQPTLYAMGDWYDSDICPGEAKDGGSLSFTLVYSNLFNMFPWSSNMQGIKDSKQQLVQVNLGLEQLYQNSEIEVHKLCDNLKVAKENIEAMERNVSIAQEAYESTLKAYNAGTQERLELQDSETQLNQAKLGLLNEKYNYVSAVLDLETKLDIKLK